MNGNTSLQKTWFPLILSWLHISRKLTIDQTHTNLGGIFGRFLQRYDLRREHGWWISDKSADRGCTFLKTSRVKNISFSLAHGSKKHYRGQTCLMSSAVLSKTPWIAYLLHFFSLLVKLYVCLHVRMFKDVYSLRATEVWVDVCAEPQRYCFGHRYELCMQQTEILKIYFFLSANYGV